MARAQAAVPPTAIRVVRVRPRRSASRPNTNPPSGRPKSIATTTKAAADAVMAGRPARVSRRKSLSLLAADDVSMVETVIRILLRPRSTVRLLAMVPQRPSLIVAEPGRTALSGRDLRRHGGLRHV